MLSRFLLTAALAAALAAPLAAQPFDPSARPAAGTLSPRADRAPEMLDFTIRGAAETGRDECYGYFEPSAPDAVVDWPGGALRLTVRSSTDATLAVVDPQGVWHCNDDGDGLAPVVELPGAARGRYVVWAGSFALGGGGAATLVAGRPAVPVAPDPSATPQERIEVTGGFSANGAVERTVVAGGLDSVPTLPIETDGVFGCNGFVDGARPSARVRYTPGGEGRLTVRAATDAADAVLLVRTPDGAWRCDDDSGDGLNPALAIDGAVAGDYAVWVGTFGSVARTEAVSATLSLAEDEVVDMDMDMDMGGFERAPYSTGTYRTLDLDARARARLELRTDEAVSTDVSVRPDGFNPISGDACRGRIEARPTAAVTIAGDGPVGITASGEGDLVMVVLAPGGDWFCSDDADGLNPGVQIDAPERGTYRVWVGSFAEMADDDPSLAATVTVARGEIVVSGGGFGMDGGFGNGEPYAEGTYDGSELRLGQAMQTLQVSGTRTEASVMAGGPMMNPVAGPTCAGFLSAEPTASVRLSGVASIGAGAPDTADDLVLVVHTPDGRWICSDDANDSSDPLVIVDSPEGGVYEIWVGTFSRRDAPIAAMLVVEM